MARRISERSDYQKGTLNFEALVGNTIIIHAATMLEGDFGEYVVCEFSYDGDEHHLSAMTGARQIVDNLRNVIADQDFPIECTVSKSGRALIIE